MATPLITVEITMTPVQAAQLSNALEAGGQDTGTEIALKLGTLLDKARRDVEAIPNCAGTKVREWLVPKEERGG
ncbi:MAG: hypothetical protein M9945_14415 [Aquamicrobium sp.]|uniref:hypothetical protein n=1 Tax=Aquamicrobium sp. TaxID=1872579 RepID=UPI00349E92DD|nr:hypothetical protein [Aquamicrobium sp.]